MRKINTTMGERIEDLLKKNNMTSKELSKKVTASGVKLSEATLSDIINDIDKGYSYKIFVEISKQLNVSTDYLLGLTDVASTNVNIKSICSYTGLSEKAVNLLNIYTNNKTPFCDTIPDFINNLITDFVTSVDYQIVNYEFDKRYIIDTIPQFTVDEYFDNFDEFQNDLFIKGVKEYQLSKYLIYSAFNKFLNDSDAEDVSDIWSECWSF